MTYTPAVEASTPSPPATHTGRAVAPVHATASCEAMAECDWPVVVIGAGVAGGLAALQLARRGWRVLLVEKAGLPRDKTCGGCLNPTALHALHQADAADLLDTLAAPTVNALHLHHRRRSATLPLPPGRAVSRRALDAALADRAIAHGAAYLDQTAARLDPEGRVTLDRDGRQHTIQPGVTLIADGLAGRALHGVTAPPMVKPHARIGIGAVIDPAPLDAMPAGRIAMYCAAAGYVGMTRVEGDRLDLAAALDPDAIRRHGGPVGVIRHILRTSSGSPEGPAAWLLDPIERHGVAWRGVPAMTRSRPQCAGHRWFALGDATGYVEPFTGEGMAWAMTAALAVQPLIDRALCRWSADLPDQWSRTIRDHRRHQQRTCRWVARTVRRPWAMRAAMALLTRRPAWAERAADHLMRPDATVARGDRGRVELT